MYKLLVDDLPFITQSESTMKKIVQKLITAGLIERLLINKNGKYTYFRKTEACFELEYLQTPEDIETIDTSCKKTKKSNNNLDEKSSTKTVHTLNNKSNLRFINFKSREYDYDRLEKKLLGWDDDDTTDLRDYRQDI